MHVKNSRINLNDLRFDVKTITKLRELKALIIAVALAVISRDKGEYNLDKG